ncbi:hypothetical protein [Methanimicrococcus stummii]|uniref:hypothetical protein n=1 Tax=Methanimicrococcus stummii TaxID=3028294 RepID=UPI00292CDD4F|nr:hypothetical protein [Methanimicrococcus sp. Es2]
MTICLKKRDAIAAEIIKTRDWVLEKLFEKPGEPRVAALPARPAGTGGSDL